MTPSIIDRTLAQFRGYLENLLGPPPAPESAPPPFDWAALVGQFTALRHDVNLQTKAVRTATEQGAEVLKLAAVRSEAPDTAKPWVKALLDITDSLALAHRQVQRTREAFAPLLDGLLLEPLPEPPKGTASPGFFAKMLGAKGTSAELQDWAAGAHEYDRDRVADLGELAEKVRPMIDGLADGYTLSLRRVEKVLPEIGLEPIECVGQPFDPELMEVVEMVGDTNRPTGSVVEEVRRGYRLAGRVFRFAQVKVAR